MIVEFVKENSAEILSICVDPIPIPRIEDHVVIFDQRGLKALEKGKQIQAKVKEVVFDYTRDIILITVAIN